MHQVVADRKQPAASAGVVSVEYGVSRTLLYQRLELLLVVALAAIYFFWFAWPLFWSASENIRLVGAFNTDEEAHVTLLRTAIDARFPRLGYIQYGYAYLNMGLLPLFLLSFITPITDQHIIVWLRIIPTLFAIATAALTFSMTRRYFGRLAAWLSIFFLAFTVLNFLEMAAMSHSDIPQLFFLMLSIYFCCRLAGSGDWRWLVWAAASAGFAFGCKYSGLFLLPLIGLYGLLHTLQVEESQIRISTNRIINISRGLTALAGGSCLFLGLVIVPYAAAPYVGTEYFGISMPQFFNMMRLLTIAAGIVLLGLAVAPFVWTFIRRRLKLVYLLKLGLLSAITFALTFFVSSPFNIFSIRSGFMRGFLYESLHSGFGHSFKTTEDKTEWFTILISPQLLDPLILVLALISLTIVLYKTVKGGWQQLLTPAVVMWLWVLFYFGFLFWRVNIRTQRALLPIIPFMLIFAAYALSQLRQYAAQRLPKQILIAATIAVLLIVAGVELPKSIVNMLDFRHTTATREQTSDAVLAGKWLAENYTPSTRILYDPFSYVPPSFSDAHVTPWGGTLELLKVVDPDVVITNNYNSDRFSDLQQAKVYVRDPTHFLAKYEYYQALIKGLVDYRLAHDFGDVQVYVKLGKYSSL